MSNYGADPKPDMNVATQTARVDKLLDLEKANATQWTYENGVFVQMYNEITTGSRLLVKFQKE